MSGRSSNHIERRIEKPDDSQLSALPKSQIMMRGSLYQLPSYSPELNPDEQVWNHAKRRTGKMPIANKAQMKDAAIRVLRSIQKTTALIKSFFQLKTTRYAA